LKDSGKIFNFATEINANRISVTIMKKQLTAFLPILLFGLFNGLSAQEAAWHTYVEQLAEEEGMDEATVENIYSELLYLESNPMDLNGVTSEQLEQFPLLSPTQITSLVTFLEKNRPLYTVYELRNVPYLDFQTVERVLPFFRVGEPKKERALSARELAKNGLHELQLRLDKTLTPRAGYKTYPDSVLERYPNRKYGGEDFYTSLRYSYRYRDKLQAGFTAEKDAGEPFLRDGYPKGYDHYGVHLLMHDIGPLKTLALGDYRLSFGQGLILNNDYGVSKSWGSDQVARRTQQPKRHFSTAESGYFRGVAALVTVGNLSFTPFYSSRKIDANLSEEGEITSFKTDGLHRTPLEMEKKGNSREQVTGANLNYRRGGLQVGISGLYHSYSRMYNPVLQEYNRYYLRDSTHLNGSVDYSYQLPGFLFAGETAIARNGAVATLNMVQYRSSGGSTLTLLHRDYPVSYNALYGQAFSESSDLRNERGLYLGGSISPLRGVTLDSYIDLVRHPWLRYGANAPSSTIDCYLLTSWRISRRTSLDLRYKYKRKEKNITLPGEEEKPLLPYATHKVRLRWMQSLLGGWDLRTTADMAIYKEQPFPAEKGFMLSQNISYRGEGALTGDAFIAFFNAESYDARLYSYERNLLSSFYMPSFYGKGLRIALSGKYALSPALTLSLKAAHTCYWDRDTIGSGTEQINGNSRTDLWCYLRWKF
jgi:hypothetical protein